MSAELAPRVPTRRSSGGSRRIPASSSTLLVGGRGLSPQVKLGPVGLHLAPDSRDAEHDDGQDDQLLHHCSFLPRRWTGRSQIPEFITDPRVPQISQGTGPTPTA